jgi:two-component system NarL family sensor kinase
LINEKDLLEITIEDNGVGFDLAKALNKDGIGLKNIQTRIEYLKGSLDIDSRMNNGTVLTFHIPLK